MIPYEELQESVIMGDGSKVKEVIGDLLKKNNSPLEIISAGLIPSMSVVGQRMKDGEMFIPEVLASAHAMSGGMELLKPLIAGAELSTIYKGKVVIGTVQGDLHNIGKKIVSMLLESGGFTVLDLGVDVPIDRFVEAIKQEQPDILGLSALLTTTMPRMRDAVEALKHNNLRDKVQVMVGGAPVTQSFADSIGADGYAPDAVSALDKIKQLLGQ
jgi:5-methyltetrahydrofolate--homocysteine methyltransferase